jgi:hypothetical protein
MLLSKLEQRSAAAAVVVSRMRDADFADGLER